MQDFIYTIIDFDQRLFLVVNSKVGTFSIIDSSARIIGSDYLVPVFLLLVLIFLWHKESSTLRRLKTRLTVLKSILTLLVACLIVIILNQILFRERPFNLIEANLIFYAPTDSSFPSNSVAAVVALTIPVFKTYRKIGWLMLSSSLCLAFCRVYVGIHFPGDVLGGILTALVSFVFSTFLMNLFSKQLYLSLLIFEKWKGLKLVRL
ncbi:MAG: undecaprenyl-diphosphatase [Chloroflexi bacterium]|nr:MAG: undecaprenyl-diphosphatase [Chloroflexota bacterium]